MKEIPLTQGKVALVDDEDYEWLNQWKWFYAKDGATGYARRMEGKKPRRTQVHMHQVIMRTPSGMEVDHKDNNGCNNQKQNLRNCTHSQNMKNEKLRKDNSSGFKGVIWHSIMNKWQAKIQCNGKRILLGYFDNSLDAARAYNLAAIKYYGEFANLNEV